MITVNQALDNGRTVFAVPGNITSLSSQGTNDLIKDGAPVVTCAEDILSEIGFTKIVIDQMDSSGNIKTLYEVKDYYSLDTSVCDFTREFYAPVGYRYKVSVVRYAKEDGWFFPVSQSIHDYSKWIYICLLYTSRCV